MHSPVPRPVPGGQGVEAAALALLAVLAGVVLVWRWVGFQGHDDVYYAAAALDWLHHFPALGTEHWALRYPLVISMAASLGLFGASLTALALPTLVAYVAWLSFTYGCMRAWFGWPAAALAVLAGILVAEFPVQATYANPDTLELAFALAAFWCHQAALRHPDRLLSLLHCGALAGLAFLTRETSAALVLYFGFLAIVRPGMPRRAYGWIALAFAVVVGLEFAYFWARTGDPLFRLHLSAVHDDVDRAAQATAAAASGHALDTEGVLAGGPAWQLFAVLCLSQKYGLLFPLAVPAVWYAVRKAWLAPAERRVIIDAALLSLGFILFIAAAGSKLYIVPRYFSAAAGAAVIPLAAAGAALWRAGPRRAAVAIGLFAVICLPLLAVENTDPLFAVRRLVALARVQKVHTDPFTAGQAGIPLAFAGLAGRLSTDPPAPGAMVAIPEGVAADCRASRTCGFKDKMGPFMPGPGWTLIRREAQPDRAIGRLVRASGLTVPGDIMRKLLRPNPALDIYQVKEGQGALLPAPPTLSLPALKKEE